MYKNIYTMNNCNIQNTEFDDKTYHRKYIF